MTDKKQRKSGVWMKDVVTGVMSGDHSRYQIEPDEKDPVCGETADEAWEKFERTGMVNPAHAHELQRRQNELRRKKRQEDE